MKNFASNVRESNRNTLEHISDTENAFNELELQRASVILNQVRHLASPVKEMEFVRLVILQADLLRQMRMEILEHLRRQLLHWLNNI